MKRLASPLIALLLMGPAVDAAVAQGQISTRSLTCRQAVDLVRSRGAVTLATGEYTFDRFVSARGFCPEATYARPALVVTRDAPQCSIGFYCSSAPSLFGPD